MFCGFCPAVGAAAQGAARASAQHAASPTVPAAPFHTAAALHASAAVVDVRAKALKRHGGGPSLRDVCQPLQCPVPPPGVSTLLLAAHPTVCQCSGGAANGYGVAQSCHGLCPCRCAAAAFTHPNGARWLSRFNAIHPQLHAACKCAAAALLCPDAAVHSAHGPHVLTCRQC